MADVNMESELVQNTKAKSAVWQTFLVKRNKNGINRALGICKLCKMEVKVPGGTTNLSTHIRRHHPSLPLHNVTPPTATSVQQQQVKVTTNQPSIIGMLKAKDHYPSTSSRAKAITLSIGTFIVADLRPYSVVNCTGFKAMVNQLDNRYVIPSRQTFSEKVIPQMYAETKERVTKSLENASHVALTTDGWTSRANDSYVTITCSFINDDWELQQYVLQTRTLPEKHTGVNIAKVLTDAISEWKLPPQPALVTDNAANMNVAATESGLNTHIGCFAHTLNLAAQKALKVQSVDRLLGRIRRVVSFFHRSTSGVAVLRSKAELLQLPKHKLIQDVCTRWNSAADMVERYLEMQPAISATVTSKEMRDTLKDLDTLSDKDISNAHQVLECLAPLRTITTALCTEKTPTISIILPVLHSLMGLKASDTDIPMVKDMKQAIVDDLSKRYTTKRDLLLSSTVMDPRFKSLQFLPEDDVLSSVKFRSRRPNSLITFR